MEIRNPFLKLELLPNSTPLVSVEAKENVFEGKKANMKHKWSSILKYILFLIVFNAFALNSYALTRYWVTGGNGQWSSTTNWSAARQSVPNILSFFAGRITSL